MRTHFLGWWWGDHANLVKVLLGKRMNIRVAQWSDIDTFFEIRTSVVENHQSREEIAKLGITPKSVAEMLATDCCAWIAEISDRPIGFSIANQLHLEVPKMDRRSPIKAVQV